MPFNELFILLCYGKIRKRIEKIEKKEVNKLPFLFAKNKNFNERNALMLL